MSATLPICCVTGRIAGDGFACGDCDPCGAAHTVPDVVKELLKERDEWADKYASSAETSDTALTRIRDLKNLIEEIVDYRGGAPSALEDEYVVERLRSALSSKD